MVSGAWHDLKVEIDRWRDIGRPVEFWWRDDDASTPNPALSRLYALATRSGIPLALAAVPDTSAHAAFEGLPGSAVIIQHGTDHLNRASAGEKKTEFSALEPVDEAIARLVAARQKLESVAQGVLLPVLAPPWNRLSPVLVPHLRACGYRGFSTFGVRKVTHSSQGFNQVNTHVDIIDWKGSRAFCGVEAALGQAIRHLAARRKGEADSTEPTGWLSHHAVHDDGCWQFLESLFEATRDLPGVLWRSPSSLFPDLPPE